MDRTTVSGAVGAGSIPAGSTTQNPFILKGFQQKPHPGGAGKCTIGAVGISDFKLGAAERFGARLVRVGMAFCRRCFDEVAHKFHVFYRNRHILV